MNSRSRDSDDEIAELRFQALLTKKENEAEVTPFSENVNFKLPYKSANLNEYHVESHDGYRGFPRITRGSHLRTHQKPYAPYQHNYPINPSNIVVLTSDDSSKQISNISRLKSSDEKDIHNKKIPLHIQNERPANLRPLIIPQDKYIHPQKATLDCVDKVKLSAKMRRFQDSDNESDDNDSDSSDSSTDSSSSDSSESSNSSSSDTDSDVAANNLGRNKKTKSVRSVSEAISLLNEPEKLRKNITDSQSKEIAINNSSRYHTHVDAEKKLSLSLEQSERSVSYVHPSTKSSNSQINDRTLLSPKNKVQDWSLASSSNLKCSVSNSDRFVPLGSISPRGKKSPIPLKKRFSRSPLHKGYINKGSISPRRLSTSPQKIPNKSQLPVRKYYDSLSSPPRKSFVKSVDNCQSGSDKQNKYSSGSPVKKFSKSPIQMRFRSRSPFNKRVNSRSPTNTRYRSKSPLLHRSISPFGKPRSRSPLNRKIPLKIYISRSPGYRERTPKFTSKSPVFRSRSPKDKPKYPRLHSHSPLFRSRSPVFGSKSPTYRRPSQRLWSKSPRRRTQSPSFVKSFRFRSKSPRMRLKSPGFRSKSPRFRSKSPLFRSKSPRFRLKSPRFKSKSPQFKSKSPRFRSKSPRFRSKSPQFRSKSPRFRSKSPRFRSKSPRFRSNSSQFRSKSPRFRAKSPRFRSKSPKFKSKSPIERNKSPKFTATSPILKKRSNSPLSKSLSTKNQGVSLSNYRKFSPRKYNSRSKSPFMKDSDGFKKRKFDNSDEKNLYSRSRTPNKYVRKSPVDQTKSPPPIKSDYRSRRYYPKSPLRSKEGSIPKSGFTVIERVGRHSPCHLPKEVPDKFRSDRNPVHGNKYIHSKESNFDEGKQKRAYLSHSAHRGLRNRSPSPPRSNLEFPMQDQYPDHFEASSNTKKRRTTDSEFSEPSNRQHYGDRNRGVTTGDRFNPPHGKGFIKDFDTNENFNPVYPRNYQRHNANDNDFDYHHCDSRESTSNFPLDDSKFVKPPSSNFSDHHSYGSNLDNQGDNVHFTHFPSAPFNQQAPPFQHHEQKYRGNRGVRGRGRISGRFNNRGRGWVDWSMKEERKYLKPDREDKFQNRQDSHDNTYTQDTFERDHSSENKLPSSRNRHPSNHKHAHSPVQERFELKGPRTPPYSPGDTSSRGQIQNIDYPQKPTDKTFSLEKDCSVGVKISPISKQKVDVKSRLGPIKVDKKMKVKEINEKNIKVNPSNPDMKNDDNFKEISNLATPATKDFDESIQMKQLNRHASLDSDAGQYEKVLNSSENRGITHEINDHFYNVSKIEKLTKVEEQSPGMTHSQLNVDESKETVKMKLNDEEFERNENIKNSDENIIEEPLMKEQLSSSRKGISPDPNHSCINELDNEMLAKSEKNSQDEINILPILDISYDIESTSYSPIDGLLEENLNNLHSDISSDSYKSDHSNEAGKDDENIRVGNQAKPLKDIHERLGPKDRYREKCVGDIPQLKKNEHYIPKNKEHVPYSKLKDERIQHKEEIPVRNYKSRNYDRRNVGPMQQMADIDDEIEHMNQPIRSQDEEIGQAQRYASDKFNDQNRRFKNNRQDIRSYREFKNDHDDGFKHGNYNRNEIEVNTGPQMSIDNFSGEVYGGHIVDERQRQYDRDRKIRHTDRRNIYQREGRAYNNRRGERPNSEQNERGHTGYSKSYVHHKSNNMNNEFLEDRHGSNQPRRFKDHPPRDWHQRNHSERFEINRRPREFSRHHNILMDDGNLKCREDVGTEFDMEERGTVHRKHDKERSPNSELRIKTKKSRDKDEGKISKEHKKNKKSDIERRKEKLDKKRDKHHDGAKKKKKKHKEDKSKLIKKKKKKEKKKEERKEPKKKKKKKHEHSDEENIKKRDHPKKSPFSRLGEKVLPLSTGGK